MHRISRHTGPIPPALSQAKKSVDRKARRRVLTLEHLEERRLLTTDTWINPAGGSWTTGANWSTGSPPAAGQDAVIPALAGNATITHSAGADTVQSLSTGTKLVLSGGTLT